ncbi:Gfo/Idh/MocA family protein [Actinoplanes xinjiangensis]|uniref:Putative dehydrogenase n=1 Tax=Actinoplanes xinjiangensis TaxID=512350 RepID=A0A316EUF7_9ACTN|nr:Gfo/Idh/MocA family oxidoreductase [Actinoplanes xinjiangensis]PWK35892.1 putative dehydrogenase [Actinoplanes xinjiangensis]GIF43075.1 oxidoreductase [Actinoplanes xinjiangensis]
MGEPHRIGIVGTGWISGAYLETLRDHPSVTIAAVADLDADRAASVAAGIPGCRARPVDELLRDDSIATILNLTVPAAHADIAQAAIKNGRQVYGEKPLTADMPTALALMEQADALGVAVGCAPDTVLGTGVQTARAAVDAGVIGTPLSAVAVMATAGHERWHHQPDFYYLPGGGPLLDMGPYYLTALVHLLGPIVAVTGAASRQRTSRVIGTGPRAGERIPVGVDTHVTGVLHHASGALSTITTSFDAVRTTAAPIEIHGETGTIEVPDPNRFAGDVRLFALGATDWQTLPPSAGYADASRGIGLLDMLTSPSPRASGTLALHVLDAMTALLCSAAEGRRIDLTTTTDRPAPVPLLPAARWRGTSGE